MADKHYIGQAKEKNVEYNGGSFTVFKIGICLEDIGLDLTGIKTPPQITAHKNGKHYFDFEMTERRTPSERGDTHSVFYTDKPNPNASGAGTAPTASAGGNTAQSTAPRANAPQSAPQTLPNEQINPEDIPF